MKILILSMQKLGDVLHSAVLIQRIRQMHPKAQISLLINDEANVIDGLLPEVDSILVFPRTLLQRQLTGQSNHLALPFHHLKSFIDELNSNNFDICFNLTFTLLSSKLFDVIQAKEKKGIGFSESKYLTRANGWFKYLNEIAMSDRQPDFLYLDCISHAIFKNGQKAIAANKAKTIDKNGPIVFQITAGDKRKELPTQFWKQLFEKIELLKQKSELKNEIIILSSAKEYNTMIANFSNASLLGQVISCNLVQARTILSKASLLVGLDTSISHLAALVSCPQIMLSLGPAQPKKIAPYLVGVKHLLPKANCFPCSHNGVCHQETQICANRLDVNELLIFIQSYLFGGSLSKEFQTFEVQESYADQYGLYITKRDHFSRVREEQKRRNLFFHLTNNIPLRKFYEEQI